MSYPKTGERQEEGRRQEDGNQNTLTPDALTSDLIFSTLYSGASWCSGSTLGSQPGEPGFDSRAEWKN